MGPQHSRELRAFHVRFDKGPATIGTRARSTPDGAGTHRAVGVPGVSEWDGRRFGGSE